MITIATIAIPQGIYASLRKHLLRGRLEQAAFLYAESALEEKRLRVAVRDMEPVSRDGWEYQGEYYLEMTDAERARLMKNARDQQLIAIECHSHPRSDRFVCFSPSDKAGIEEFLPYVRWKLNGVPYVATVWGQRSVDAVLWMGSFSEPHPIDSIVIAGARDQTIKPRFSWRDDIRRVDHA